MLIKFKTLVGYLLKGSDGNFGRLGDFLFDDKHWAVRYLVADTGTWLTDRQVLLSPYSFGLIDEKRRLISVKLTRHQIEHSPLLSTDLPVSSQFEAAYHSHYAWRPYWLGPYAWGPFREPQPLNSTDKNLNSDGSEWNPHLRTMALVCGHTLQATDGEIGHVIDFVIDSSSWAIRYLVVDTTDWWPGKQVLISAAWISKVNWEHLKVFTKLTRSEVQNSPTYTSTALITREYEAKLHGHFNREGYWIDPLN